MSFSWDINLGHAVTIGLALIGLIGAWVTIRIKTSDNEEKTRSLNTRVDAYGTALADLRLHVEAVCVKKDDLQRVEDRITERIGTVEHTVRNTSATILAALSGNRDGGRPRP